MPTYVGFSTINANKPRSTDIESGVDGGPGSITSPIIIGKKFRLVDEPLVIQDFINSLNIRQGEKVGNPAYGSNIWSYVFEPNNPQMRFRLEDDLRQIASQDPRLIINEIRTYPRENGVLIEIELAIAPLNNPQILKLFFDSVLNKVTMQ